MYSVFALYIHQQRYLLYVPWSYCTCMDVALEGRGAPCIASHPAGTLTVASPDASSVAATSRYPGASVLVVVVLRYGIWGTLVAKPRILLRTSSSDLIPTSFLPCGQTPSSSTSSKSARQPPKEIRRVLPAPRRSVLLEAPRKNHHPCLPLALGATPMRAMLALRYEAEGHGMAPGTLRNPCLAWQSYSRPAPYSRILTNENIPIPYRTMLATMLAVMLARILIHTTSVHPTRPATAGPPDRLLGDEDASESPRRTWQRALARVTRCRTIRGSSAPCWIGANVYFSSIARRPLLWIRMLQGTTSAQCAASI